MDGTERWTIYHIFADDGVESEPLSAYGDVVRVGLNPRENEFSTAIKANAKATPLKPGADLVVLHPPCYPWTQRDAEDAENLVPLARELGERLGEEYIIENKPDAPLRDPVVLDGSMFGLPVEYKRAFETSYEVEQPRGRRDWSPEHRVENTRPKGYWKGVKGVSGDYRTQTLALSGTPACYIHYLLRPLVDPYHEIDTEQATLVRADGGRNGRSETTGSERSEADQ
jgi:hypothetical protein